MKRKCKNIDITDRELISRAVYKCIWDKLTRRDVVKLLSAYSGLGQKFIARMISDCGKNSVHGIIETIVDGIQGEIREQKIVIRPIHYHNKEDESNHKIREIGVQDIKQQLYDYIAVEGLSPLLSRIGEYQCASIPGRGQIYGIKAIKRWLQNPNIKYAAQLDIRKCYESVDKVKMMVFLQKHVKNDLLLWLIEKLIQTFKKGLSIGSYLSQFLCNLYLSQIYHEIMENMHKVRKRRKGGNSNVNLVSKTLMFMDDILMLGSSAKDLHKAVALTTKEAIEIGFDIKETWKVFRRRNSINSNGQFIDIMGFRVYRLFITIRERVFFRIRKTLVTIMCMIKTHRHIPVSLARKCLSYNGEIVNSNSLRFAKKYHADKIVNICKREVSNEQKRCNLLCETA